jgi:hypothetical protein
MVKLRLSQPFHPLVVVRQAYRQEQTRELREIMEEVAAAALRVDQERRLEVLEIRQPQAHRKETTEAETTDLAAHHFHPAAVEEQVQREPMPLAILFRAMAVMGLRPQSLDLAQRMAVAVAVASSLLEELLEMADQAAAEMDQWQGLQRLQALQTLAAVVVDREPEPMQGRADLEE